MSPTFSELGLKADLVSALAKQSISEPTPIQVAAIPLLLEKKDLYLQAETGTGKTLAYLLPIFARIDLKLSNVQAVIVAPTHELAIQIQKQCVDLAQQSGIAIKTIPLIGGVSPARQIENLKKKPQIVVGSPGRIRELIESRKLKSHLVQIIVLDEADRLLAAESFPDLQAIVKSTPKDRNIIFVSATEQTQTSEAFASLSANTIVVKTSATQVNADIDHIYLLCEQRDKAEMLRKFIHASAPLKSIVFLHRNEDAEIVAGKLAHHKLNVIDVHASHDKEERKNAMQKIRSGRVDVLIASDLAARGLDIKGLTHVINYDLPSNSAAYLHRAGRTGRAGESGIALSLISREQLYLIERYKKDLKIELIEVFLHKGKICRVAAAE